MIYGLKTKSTIHLQKRVSITTCLDLFGGSQKNIQQIWNDDNSTAMIYNMKYGTGSTASVFMGQGWGFSTKGKS
jgi:hypothetical protein